jgi:molybdopterin biosynthesis enzyme
MTASRSLTACADAQPALLAMLAPVAPREVACANAVGLIAAGAAPLQEASPPRAIALREGYAVRSRDLAGASSFSPACLAAAPQHVRIGDPLPEGCDCVLDPGALDVSGATPLVFSESYPGENTRRAGEDFAVGAIVIAAGRKVSARDALAAAQAGVARIGVRVPRISVSGDAALAQFVSTFARADGAEITRERADLCISIGDAPTSAVWSARGIALEPGRDCAIGRIGTVPAVYLPAAPDQAVAGYMALVRPALDRLGGRVRAAPRALPLAAKISSRVGVAELALLREQDGRFTPLCVGDCPLHALTSATHLALIDAGSEGLGAGDICAADPLDDCA